MSFRRALAKSIDGRSKRLYGRLHRLTKSRLPAEMRNYAIMKEDNLGASDYYREGAFWKAINREFEDFLRAGALPHLRNEYINRRFAGPEPASRQVWRALLWVYYQKLLELDIDNFLKHASEPSAGGTADQELIDGRPMSLDFLQSVEEAYRIREAWAQAGLIGQPKLIVELGAGYGRLAYVCRKMLPDCTYVILDLPEALICAEYWLGHVLPGEVVPYPESRQISSFTREELLSQKVWILGAHQIQAIEEGSVDAFVNIYSLAEMPQRSIDNYFVQINRITRGVFYSKQRKLERNVNDNTEITLDSYPVQPHWRTLFLRTSTLYESFFEVAYSLADEGTRP